MRFEKAIICAVFIVFIHGNACSTKKRRCCDAATDVLASAVLAILAPQAHQRVHVMFPVCENISSGS